MKYFALVSAAALAVSAMPANAVVTNFALTGPTTSSTSFSYTVGKRSLTATAGRYAVAPGGLDLFSEITFGQQVRRFAAGNPAGNAGGLGVFTTGDSQPEQVDNDGTNELLRFGLSGANAAKSRLASAKFNFVDADDTLRVYGVNGTTLTLLGFAGEFVDNTPTDALISGGATVTRETAGTSINNNNVYRVDFGATAARYDSFLFTSNRDSADGYRVQSISLAVPEPETWAMMVGGFGLLGVATRRRRGIRIVTA